MRTPKTNLICGLIGEFDDAIINQIEIVLDVLLEPRNSDYWLYDANDCRIKIYYNIDPMHDEKNDDPSEYYFDYANKDCGTIMEFTGYDEWISIVQGKISKLKGVRQLETNK